MATNITWHSSHVKVCIQRIYCVGRMWWWTDTEKRDWYKSISRCIYYVV